MRNYVFIFVVALLLAGCATTKQEKRIITGEFSWSQWQKEAGWHNYNASAYEPGDYISGQLNAIITSPGSNIEFLLFSGSWCGDSESEVPKIFKLFTEAKIPLSKITLYGVDREKKEPEGIAEKYKIKRVPTLVVLKNGKELGRIIEFPAASWEEDIFKILIKS